MVCRIIDKLISIIHNAALKAKTQQAGRQGKARSGCQGEGQAQGNTMHRSVQHCEKAYVKEITDALHQAAGLEMKCEILSPGIYRKPDIKSQLHKTGKQHQVLYINPVLYRVLRGIYS